MNSNRCVIKWVANYSKVIGIQLILLIILSATASVTSVGFALTSREVIDVATKHNSGNLLESCTKLGLLIFVQLLLNVLLSGINVRTQGKFEIELKQKLFYKLIKKDWRSLSFHSGELINRLTSDVGVVSNGVVNIVPAFIAMFVSIITSFIALCTLDWILGVIILLIGPLVMFSARIYSKKMKLLHKKCQESDGKTKSYIQEILQNIVVVKAFCNEENASNSVAELQKNNYKLKVRRNTINIYANIGLYLIFTFGYYFALAWGAVKLSHDIISFGTLTAILQLVSQVQMPFKNISGLIPQIFTSIGSVERMMEIENLKEDEKELNINAEDTYFEMSTIVIDSLSFRYNDESDCVFDNASFTINKGEFIAIAGTSGVGKSTLLYIMLGLVSPCSGGVYLNCDCKRIMLDSSTRNMFGYVPQSSMIFSGSIKENICFFKENIPDEDVLKCAEIAQLKDLIDELPNGINTMLKEFGEGLSEGQIQRIAIARALLYNAPILLLDEATSALDEKTERALLYAIRLIDNKTCIIISHKKASFDICDRVINIHNGKVGIV